MSVPRYLEYLLNPLFSVRFALLYECLVHLDAIFLFSRRGGNLDLRSNGGRPLSIPPVATLFWHFYLQGLWHNQGSEVFSERILGHGLIRAPEDSPGEQNFGHFIERCYNFWSWLVLPPLAEDLIELLLVCLAKDAENCFYQHILTLGGLGRTFLREAFKCDSENQVLVGVFLAFLNLICSRDVSFIN